MDEKIPEIIFERAVYLWKQLLSDPKYDNGDSSLRGAVASSMAKSLPSNASAEKIDEFGEALKSILMDEQTPEHERRFLDVDYHPCTALANAAKAVGLKLEFPWKTTIRCQVDYLICSAGYGGEWLYHYPISDGRWLVTTLSGSEITKVVEYVNGGRPDFRIDEPM